MADSPLESLYRLTLPLTIGRSRARHAYARPATVSSSSQYTSGRSGLARFRQSVTASGLAPVAMMLRAAPATASWGARGGARGEERALQAVGMGGPSRG